jgi:transketolase
MMTTPTKMTSPSGVELSFWSREQLLDAWNTHHDVGMLATGCRLNALSAIQGAGSGHIGTSFSSLDIMVSVRKFLAGDSFLSANQSDRGIFFSSKGHDAPALYALMHLVGQLEDKDLLTLRRLGGLPGHPETITPGVPTNTGSLGMGISKAKGFIKAQRLNDASSRNPVVVMLGDGELNEGQIWESMPGAAQHGFSELIAIVDANGIQSDTWTAHTLPVGDLRARVEAVGWQHLECDGHTPADIERALHEADSDARPSFIFAKTTKGSGVTWMENFDSTGAYYKFHSGAIAADLYEDASRQLIAAFTGEAATSSFGSDVSRNEFDAHTPRPRPESMLVHWEQLLPELMAEHPDIVIMDGDLSYDTGTHLARKVFPERYIQAGIAEQDMVSMAGTLALAGKTPIVHSFSTFLTMRAAEQIFNNATEYSRVLYFGFLAGLVPSAPGFSHQAVSDVGLMSSVPRMVIIEPACRAELQAGITWALQQDNPVYFRMGGLAPLAEASSAAVPHGLTARVPGEKVALIASGPLLAQEALQARAMIAQSHGFSPAVFTMPWMASPLDASALKVLGGFAHVIVLENHNETLAKYEVLSDQLRSASTTVHRIGLSGIPANGQPAEVLNHHEVDANAIARKIGALHG